MDSNGFGHNRVHDGDPGDPEAPIALVEEDEDEEEENGSVVSSLYDR